MLAMLALLIVLATAARWFWLAFKVQIPETPTVYLALWICGALLGLLSLLTTGFTLAAVTAIGFGALFAFLAATSGQLSGDDIIEVGDRLPQFSAADDDGVTFDSATLAGSPALIKFFRGHW